MHKNPNKLFLSLALFSASLSALAAPPDSLPSGRSTAEFASRSGILWRNPADIRSRNLLFGSGGIEHRPKGPFTFVKEDPKGTNPKFVVRDGNGVEWKVKLGQEARPETVASRFVWAVGYFTADDYFLPILHLQNKPAHLNRGQKFMSADGSFSGVRLKRENKDQKKAGTWEWRESPMAQTREFNGLRVLMALINNWDLKDENNAVYVAKDANSKVYAVSDLGASFGTTGLSWSQKHSKGNLNAYRHSEFVRKITPEFVDFNVPSRPAWINIFSPKSFITRLGLIKIGRHVPREDAHWMGQLLARLTPTQIRDAFRAGGYSPAETEAFANVIEERIAILNRL
jgi:hypothetical protein